MARKPFDISKYAPTVGVSESDTVREEIAYIDLKLLDEDKDNFYRLSEIPELASNIQVCGLQQPIRVRKGEGGRYTIVSGHRRRAALVHLVREGHKEFAQVPCIIEGDSVSDAMRELRLIFANSGTREMTSAEKAKEAERVEMLLYRLKEEGYEFPGRMRDQVAAACKTSSTKLAVWKVIRENLIEEYLALYEKDKIKESAAYALAKVPAEFQRKVYVACKEKVVGAYMEEALKRVQTGEWDYSACMTCPDGRSCTHAAAFIRHDMNCYRWDQCGGVTCCLNCSQATRGYANCENMCSKAKAARKEAADKEKASKEKKEAKERSRRAKANLPTARRILRAADAAGVDGRTRLAARYYGDAYTVDALRAFVDGDESALSVSSDDALVPYYTENLLQAAKLLHCSTDYLLGLTDELNPAPQPEGQLMICGWMPGGTNPKEPCMCSVLMDHGDGDLRHYHLRWTGSAWWFSNIDAAVDEEPVAWMALPEYERSKDSAED